MKPSIGGRPVRSRLSWRQIIGRIDNLSRRRDTRRGRDSAWRYRLSLSVHAKNHTAKDIRESCVCFI